ncbi:MAG: trypsin-like peptidase domain-containing protein [Ardenticatenaceae bacterium]|nr:trypsin-like peptidase domain-containing protein [Ardenticatenaceae bacterium]MCB8987026.1 trypsin-like peptidase domain-containing protein [Ardenticatenaceae bacterium]
MSNVLTELSDTLANTVANAGAGVVRVEGRRRIPATGIVWSTEGLIVTAHHVVSRDENIQIGLPDGRSTTATLVGRDPATDTAVLRADAADLTPFTESNKQELGVGNLVLALGRPGKTVQATLGIVSALGDSWRTRMGGQVDRYLQTDVVMYPGFSGGPLVDAYGRLAGMNTSALMGGVSLAIPTATLARVTDALVAHGRMKRGYLGVSTQRVKLPDELREQLGQKSGLLIVSAESGSPASAAGLTLGDTIVTLDNEKVRDHDDLLALLTGERVGTAVPVSIVRGGQVQQVQVTIGERE